MTKREQAILAAMTGILANPKVSKDTTPWYDKIFQWFFPSTNRCCRLGDVDDVLRVSANYADEFITKYSENEEQTTTQTKEEV